MGTYLRRESLEQYSREHNTDEQPGKQYAKATTLPEIVNTAPMPQFKSGRHSAEMEKGASISRPSGLFVELI